ncbi:FMR1 neighbor protein isoform X1 [Paroedura picta]|uniref:FMR1 neighbor protein isoform X1 n=1 Tax=Paroedura picta TaxID=143630 RepID=UPI004055A7FB
MISVIPILAKFVFLMHCAVSSSLASPTQHDLNGTEVVLSQGKTKPEIISEQLVNFFNPVTCRPKENQVVEPCLAGENMNETLCLKHSCCPSYKGHVKLKCYGPLKDRALQTLRVCCIGAAGLFIFGCLPFCCVFVEKRMTLGQSSSWPHLPHKAFLRIKWENHVQCPEISASILLPTSVCSTDCPILPHEELAKKQRL